MRSESYLFGAAAVGITVATALIFGVTVPASSSVESELTSFSINATTETALQINNAPDVSERKVRVVHPSPYQSAAPRSGITSTH